jgi:hypothetical protein
MRASIPNSHVEPSGIAAVKPCAAARVPPGSAGALRLRRSAPHPIRSRVIAGSIRSALAGSNSPCPGRSAFAAAAAPPRRAASGREWPECHHQAGQQGIAASHRIATALGRGAHAPGAPGVVDDDRSVRTPRHQHRTGGSGVHRSGRREDGRLVRAGHPDCRRRFPGVHLDEPRSCGQRLVERAAVGVDHAPGTGSRRLHSQARGLWVAAELTDHVGSAGPIPLEPPTSVLARQSGSRSGRAGCPGRLARLTASRLLDPFSEARHSPQCRWTGDRRSTTW